MWVIFGARADAWAGCGGGRCVCMVNAWLDGGRELWSCEAPCTWTHACCSSGAPEVIDGSMPGRVDGRIAGTHMQGDSLRNAPPHTHKHTRARAPTPPPPILTPGPPCTQSGDPGAQRQQPQHRLRPRCAGGCGGRLCGVLWVGCVDYCCVGCRTCFLLLHISWLSHFIPHRNNKQGSAELPPPLLPQQKWQQ